MKDEKLDNLDKAALFLYSLGEEVASGVLKHMDESEVKKITMKMAQLDSVSAVRIEEVLREFSSFLASSSGVMVSVGESYAKSIVSRAFGEKNAEKMLQSIPGQDSGASFEVFKNLDPRVLSDFVKNEHPQTIALIISHLYPEEAGEVLAALPEALQVDVIARMASLDSVPSDIVNDIAHVLESEIKAVKMKAQKLGGVKTISEILNQMDRTLSSGILTKIEENTPELAESIRENMFVFEDLVQIDDRGFQDILKEISTDELAKAMKTASEAVKDKVYSNMSERAAEMLKEDLEDMGPTRLTDIEKAQMNIVKVAMKLADEGKIILGAGGEDVLV